MSIDPAAVTEILRTLSEKIIMPQFGRLSAGDIQQKSSPNDLVTIVDHEAEAFLEEALAPLAPGAEFIGEEGAAAAPEIVARLEKPGRYWVIDPLDGTRNFVKRINEFATILAYVEDGVTTMGWIYAHPDAACAVSVKGDGVSWRDGEISIAPQEEGRPQGFRSLGWLPEADADRLRANLKKHTVTKPGHCSAYAYLKLVFGAVDFKLSSRIHPWDHAAGVLMLEELGGHTAFLDSNTPYAPSDSVDSALLAVAPGRDWESLSALIGSR
ncbi:MAG: inositol monophosphatase family protein [Pseudomonadota bacterium]